MKTEILLAAVLLTVSSAAAAQNSSQQDSQGILSSIPDIEISPADSYNNSTGQNSVAPSRESWIIIMGLVFLGVLMYSFEIDPKWIVMLVGLTGLVFLLHQLGIITL